MIKRALCITSVVLSGLASLAPAAHGANLVSNGGFEAGTFAGWSGTGETVFNGVQCPGPGPGVYEGACGAFFGPVESVGGIQQVVNLGSVGQAWNLSFAFQADGAVPSSFSVLFGGQTLLSLTNPSAASSYTVYNFAGVGTTQNMTLAFNFLDPAGFLYLDAVSVTAVPEPGTTALLGAGLAGLAFWRRRKGQSAAGRRTSVAAA